MLRLAALLLAIFAFSDACFCPPPWYTVYFTGPYSFQRYLRCFNYYSPPPLPPPCPPPPVCPPPPACGGAPPIAPPPYLPPPLPQGGYAVAGK
ncbi:hypothetical protein Y032_0194g1445 [Ancylostoma ceylanicum]|uniref:Uncharacterized protein n=1 Tax=Ancylostoma ceylanicum TaxID=53326 RepID=A0A016SP01_9BILA|nr:hypothetical protein Y032_0194g1445 [Ancylostoma ceylanicum]